MDVLLVIDMQQGCSRSLAIRTARSSPISIDWPNECGQNRVVSSMCSTTNPAPSWIPPARAGSCTPISPRRGMTARYARPPATASSTPSSVSCWRNRRWTGCSSAAVPPTLRRHHLAQCRRSRLRGGGGDRRPHHGGQAPPERGADHRAPPLDVASPQPAKRQKRDPAHDG